MQTGTLRAFCDVIEANSFSVAAQKNDFPTSRACHSFRLVEDYFGVRCAVRDRQHFQVTPEGRLCHEHFLEILRFQREAERRVRRLRENSAHIFRLAACFSFGFHQLQPVLRQFRQAFPHIQIHDRYGHIVEVHELVLNNEVDLGLVAYPRRSSGLAIEPVRDERLVLVCHPQHRLAAQPAISLAALRGLPIIAWKEIPWTVFLRKIPGTQRHLFEPRHEFNEVEMVKQAVEKDVGIALLPGATVESEVADHLLVALRFENGNHTEPLAAIYRKNRKLTPAMKSFIQALKQPA
jgi:DNA-binding transcriptional LysR family regulator